MISEKQGGGNFYNCWHETQIDIWNDGGGPTTFYNVKQS